jgi:hypothetical protein
MSCPPHSVIWAQHKEWTCTLNTLHKKQSIKKGHDDCYKITENIAIKKNKLCIHCSKVIQKSDFTSVTDIFNQRRYLKTKLHQTNPFTEQLREIVHTQVSCISREQQCLNRNLLEGGGNVPEPKGNIYSSPIQLAACGPHPACKMLPTGLAMVFNLG